MAKRVGIDKWLFGSTLLLVVIGVVMVFSASAVMAGDRFGSPYYFLLRQLGWAVAGLGAMAAIMNFDYRHWKHPAIVFTLLALAVVTSVTASSTRVTNGFSTNTCLPAVSISRTTGKWCASGVATLTASIVGSAAISR